MDTSDEMQQLLQLDDLMARLQRLWNVQSHVQHTGLTATQSFLLRFLTKSSQAKASELARTAGLSPGAVTQVCDELERMGYIDRTRSNDDRRVVYVTLTDRGRAQFEQIRIGRAERLQAVLSKLDAKDRDDFTRIVGRVVQIVEDEAASRGNVR